MYTLDKPDSQWWAYFAGLVAGEGCISVSKNLKPSLSLEMCDEGIVQNVADMLGGTVNVRPARRDNWASSYQWRTQNLSVVYGIMIKILPYLHGKKREQADYTARLALLRNEWRTVRRHRPETEPQLIKDMVRLSHEIRSRSGGAYNTQWLDYWDAKLSPTSP